MGTTADVPDLEDFTARAVAFLSSRARPREEIEFHYGGQAHIAYPEEPAALDDVEWAHYVFFRDNVKGLFAERWSHAAGCRRWFNALRDTVSYRFEATYKPGERPVLQEGTP